jgi:hypothetical protein
LFLRSRIAPSDTDNSTFQIHHSIFNIQTPLSNKVENLAAMRGKLSLEQENVLQSAGNFLQSKKPCCNLQETFYKARKRTAICRKLSYKEENLQMNR